MIHLTRPRLSEEGKKDLLKTIDSGWWTTGKQVEKLESDFAKFKKVSHAVGVSSCSAGMILALRVLGINHESVFYTSPLTFCSTVNAGLHVGAYLVLVDVDLETQCIHPDQLQKGMGSFQEDDVIIPVHFAGFPCDMDTLLDIKEQTGISIVEDCAHAVEGIYKGQSLGTFGDFGVFSFNPTKNIQAPEMGMVITSDEELAEKTRLLRLHGLTVSTRDRMNKIGQYDIVDLGYKFNPTDLEAAMAQESLRWVGTNWLIRKQVCMIYDKVFMEFKKEGIFNGRTYGIPKHPADDLRCGHHLYTIQLKNRDGFIEKMRKAGVFCGIHYKPIHLFTYYRERFGFVEGDFPNAEFIGKHTCSLPLDPNLTQKQIDQIIQTSRDILREGDYLI